MSLEERVSIFHDAATNKGKSKGPAKEVATLRKFIHRNQDQRFSDKATARLVDTISCWIRNDELAKDAKEDLLADALKMPFTVFGTKQKKQFLKWLHELTGDNSRGLESTVLPESDANTDVEVYEVIDVISDLKGGEMTLMNVPVTVLNRYHTDDGDEITMDLQGVRDCAKIRSAFESNQAIKVTLNTRNNAVLGVALEKGT